MALKPMTGDCPHRPFRSNFREDHRVLDIRRDEIQSSIVDDINTMLRPSYPDTEKRLPTMLLYDEIGLKLFEDITYLEEYYLTNAEIEILGRYADAIADRVLPGSQIVELGSGNLRKIDILLQALDRAGKDVDYYALDLSLSELQRTLEAVPPQNFKYVRCHGLHGTYDDGLAWLGLPENRERPKLVMSMGSSIGNFNRGEASIFLKGFSDMLQPGDMLLVGVDGCQDERRVYCAYNDCLGKTHEFYRNGLAQANKLLGEEVFEQCDWDVIGESSTDLGCHQAFVSPKRSFNRGGFSFKAGERIRIEESYKYTKPQQNQLWIDSNLQLEASFAHETEDFFLNLLSIPVSFSLDPKTYAPSYVPTLMEFEQLWKAWDLVTRRMIPHDELLSRPINLRNCCLFYLGHIPTFTDIHLTRATDGLATEPRSYRTIFERGIDPDVDNPESCHAHSELPDTWPPIEDIIAFQNNVRKRIITLYRDKDVKGHLELAKALWLGFEHEAMHLETLLYMLIQSDRALPPPGKRPDFESLAHKARMSAVPNTWIRVPEREIAIGLDTFGDQRSSNWCFGWDNEKPLRKSVVSAFEAQARGLTNGDYARYLMESGTQSYPASWEVVPDAAKIENHGNSKVLMNGYATPSGDAFFKDKAIRTVYGPVPLLFALEWPVMASYDELSACAEWFGGRVPTMSEVRSIYSFVEDCKEKKSNEALVKTMTTVNELYAHEKTTSNSAPLCKDKVTLESAPKHGSLYVDLQGCNVGLQAFHPDSIVQNGNSLAGLSGMGGVWEWTSSVLEEWDGFQAMKEYPGYTADFFDGKHNIMLGGSWATHPRIAGRKSFINWYQRNYPYVWAGARLVRDI